MPEQVSVIIPAFNQGQYIADAIRSVTAQTFPHWELIVVDDGSTDNTREVVAQFLDPRIRYFYQANKGLSAARNRGMAESSAEYVAFLDSDDMFRPDRLRLQVEILNACPEVGLVYGPRIEVDDAGNPLRLGQAPSHVSLGDLVIGFPFAPTDFIVRREWLQRVGGWDETYTTHGEDRDLWVRLVLEGCLFRGINRAMSYRRRYANRVQRNTEAKLAASLRALETLFLDPRCPANVHTLRSIARGQLMRSWALEELLQGDSTLASKHLEDARRESPQLFANDSDFLSEIVYGSVRSGGDHESQLNRVFVELPEMLKHLKERRQWAIGRGYMMRGASDAIWNRPELARANFNRAAALHASIDRVYLQALAADLLKFQAEFGSDAAQSALENVAPHLEMLGGWAMVRWLTGCYSINRAFQNYCAGQFADVSNEVVRAISNDWSYLANRGVLKILFHSIVGRAGQAANKIRGQA